RSIEVPGNVEDQPSMGILPISATPEAVHQYFTAASAARTAKGRQLEDRSCGVRAAIRGRAIEVAGVIEDQPSVGIQPVRRAVTEAVQYRLRPAASAVGRHFKRRPAAVSSAIYRRSIEVPGTVEDQPSMGILPISATPEAVHQYFTAASAARTAKGRQLEDRSGGVRAAIRGRAIEVARVIEHQSGVGIQPVRSVAEAV